MLNSIEKIAICDMLCEADHSVFEEDVTDLILDIFEQNDKEEDIEDDY